MPYFETTRVFTICTNSGEIGVRGDSDIQPVDYDQPVKTYRHLFRATGLHRMDFAVFGASFDAEGAEEHGLLVITEQQGIGTLVDADYLAVHPEYLTAEFAKKIATVGPAELEDFTIQPILDAVATRFPHARGFSR